MSDERFWKFLQELLTMVEPDNPTSVECVENILNNLLYLAEASGKCDPEVYHMMRVAAENVDRLVEFKDDFAGVKGAFWENKAKRQRLMNMLRPGC